ncbi:MAG: formimidoylglutamate deiminase [Actinomycetota bacterium]
MTTLWCEQAWLAGDDAEQGVLIEVDGENIASVTPGVSPPAGATSLWGLTLPGFANAHSHAFHRMMRGRSQQGSGSFWTWREKMYEAAAALDPDSYRVLAAGVFSEMVAAGYTVVGEFHYLHHGPGGIPYENPHAMGEALVEAARLTGIRLTIIDSVYLHGGLDGRYLPLEAFQTRFSDGSAEAWVDRFTSWRTEAKRALAVHSVRAVDPEAMQAVAVLARHRQLPVHAHVSEQPAENDACRAVHGCTPTELLASVGLVDANFTAVHGTHLTDHDIRLLGEAQATVCLCPTTERDLADGIGPSMRLAATGARLAIGSDSQAIIDPFEETRAVELNQRLTTLRRGNHSLQELLSAATVNGYRSLGWEGGVLAPGGLADLVTINFDSERLRGIAPEHWLAAAVFAATASDVTSVMVGGHFVADRPGF